MTVPSTHGRYRHAGDTGPTAGTVFSTPEGGLTVTTPGAIIENRIFYGTVKVTAPDVIVRNCKVDLRIAGIYAIDATSVPASLIGGAYSLSVEDCDIDGGLLNVLICVGIFGNTALRRCHVHGGSDGVRLNGNNVLVEDCWVHDQVRFPGAHCDCTQTTGGLNIISRRNRLEAYKIATDDNFNSAMQVSSDDTDLDLTVEDNYMDGGSYIINGDYNVATAHTAAYRRNRFGPHFRNSYTRSSITTSAGVTWEATNVVDLTDEPVV